MRSFSYRVDPETYLLDYADLKKKVKKVKPLILMVGYSAYPRLINTHLVSNLLLRDLMK
jgi:glycine hydroxymethyltransferase